jgi:hypothetical protein
MVLQRDGNKVYWQEGSGESGTATLTEVTKIADTKPAIPVNPKPQEAAATADASAKVEMPHNRFATANASTKPIEGPLMSKHGGAAEVMNGQPATTPHPPARGEQLKARAHVARQPRAPVIRSRQSKPFAAPVQLFRVTGVHAGDELRVRSGPSEDHAPVGGIPFDGRKVEIIGECFDVWCLIRHGRVVGWVNSYYLEKDSVPRGLARN